MTAKEKEFSDALDLKPLDWVLRGIYADWLNDQGRYEDEATQRWMIKEKRATEPYNFALTGRVWTWYSDEPSDPSWLEQEIHCYLKGGKLSEPAAPGGWRDYKSRRASELALREALIRAGIIQRQPKGRIRKGYLA